MEIVRTIKLYGPLAKEFGHVHRLAVANVAEAVRALCVIKPGFEAFLMNAKDKGMEFAVFTGQNNLSFEELRNPVGKDEIRLVPIIVGRKAGAIQTIVGAALIVVGVAMAWTGVGASLSPYLINAGIAMMVGGIIQMLSPQPKADKQDQKDDGQSYLFNGVVNVQSQGNPVPVLYGELLIGSMVISAGISTVDNYAVPLTSAPSSGVRGGGGYSGDVNSRARNALQ